MGHPGPAGHAGEMGDICIQVVQPVFSICARVKQTVSPHRPTMI